MLVKVVADYLKKAKKTVVLTGAGISTASGIPDFRSADGLYSKYPEDVLSKNSFFNQTELFYEAFMYKFKPMMKAEPNEGHKILAKWEKNGLLNGVITQNIDGLHQKAGSRNVVEYHGTIRTFTLQNNSNFLKVRLEDILDEKGNINYYYQNIKDKEHLLKPDVILFGDTVEQHERARGEIKGADLVFIIGTSFVVYPFNTLVKRLKPDATVVIINNEFVDVKTIAKKIKLKGDITSLLKDIDSYI